MLIFNDIQIVTVADFYKYFDIMQAMEQEKEVLRFAERNLAYASPLNLCCCTVLRRVQQEAVFYDGKSGPRSFWRIGGCVSNVPFLNQMEFEELFYSFYDNLGEDWFALYLRVTAIILLGKQNLKKGEIFLSKDCKTTESKVLKYPFDKTKSQESALCIPQKIDVTDLKNESQTQEMDELPKDSVAELAPGKCYRYFCDLTRVPEADERIRTIELQAPINLDSSIIFLCPDMNAKSFEIERGCSLFVNAIGNTVVSILKNESTFKGITLRRERKGIYAYEGNTQLDLAPVLPFSVSSFAVLGRDAYVYIENGELDYTSNVSTVDPDWYEYADSFSEVENDGKGMPIVLDNRGRVYSCSVKFKGKTGSLSKLIKE